MTGPLAGGCRCGAIRYTLADKAMPPVYCCHCRDCQTWSASAFSEQAVVRDGDLTVTAGKPMTYAFASPSGATSRQYVCGTCHTRLYNTNSARPGIVLVRAGTLDASDTLEPRAHIWVKRKQPWIDLPAGVPAFPENAPPDIFRAILIGEER